MHPVPIIVEHDNYHVIIQHPMQNFGMVVSGNTLLFSGALTGYTGLL